MLESIHFITCYSNLDLREANLIGLPTSHESVRVCFVTLSIFSGVQPVTLIHHELAYPLIGQIEASDTSGHGGAHPVPLSLFICGVPGANES